MKHNTKVAIVHDYLIDFGGAERVLVALHEMYPNAPIYTSIYRPKLLGKFADNFSDAKIIQSFFGYIPYAEKLISPLRFLLPLIWNSIDLKAYNLILSSSSWAIAKGFDKRKGAIEICYCHTPPRYLYGYDTSRKFTGIFGNLVWFYSLIVNHFMRMYDFKSAQKVDYFIANSIEIQNRIKKFYRRNSIVVYPPIEVPYAVSFKTYGMKLKAESYFLAGGRLVSAKNFDLIIKAFNKLKLSLKIYGTGVLENELKNISGENIEFLGKVSDEELNDLYQNAKAFVVAQKDEDFGMTLVEAQSQGCPVIAYRGGGYTESIIENKTGVFFEELTVESITTAIKKYNNSMIRIIESKVCIQNAKRFSKERFKREMIQFINAKVSKA